MRQTTAEVIADPERFAKSVSECRYVRVARFPYVVLFDLVGQELQLIGVLHTARSIEKWRERLAE